MKLSNGIISIEVSTHGAELISLKKGDTEYVWQADPEYWKRSAPILFPIVGKVWNGEYKANGGVYKLPQHGFARDMDFEVVKADANALVLALDSSEETLAKYPYEFHLEAKYTLEGSTVHILWTVKNPSSEEMYCQIGAHPAFNYPEFSKADEVHAYAELFDAADAKVESLEISRLGAQGCCSPLKGHFEIPGGQLPLTADLFSGDALVQEGGVVKKVTLFDKQQAPFLTVVSHCCEVMALWSPPQKDAPFVCIEPWLGRTDRVEFTGDFSEKDWIQRIAPAAALDFDYSITV